MTLAILDIAWNDAIEAAAKSCEDDARGLRSQASGGDGSEGQWGQANRLDESAKYIRRLKRAPPEQPK